MLMARLKKPLATAIDPELSDELEAWVAKRPPWRKVDVIEKALREFFDKSYREEAAKD